MRVIPRSALQGGFTLIEMMMVLLIIGLMSSAVLLTVPDKEPTAKAFTENMVRELNLAAQTSLLSGQPAALGLTRDGYGIYAFRGERWAAPPLVRWPENTSVRFAKNNLLLELPVSLVPLLVFEPTGQSDVFNLTLTQSGKVYALHSAGDGRIVRGPLP